MEFVLNAMITIAYTAILKELTSVLIANKDIYLITLKDAEMAAQ
jgi:hypothetical protein